MYCGVWGVAAGEVVAHHPPVSCFVAAWRRVEVRTGAGGPDSAAQCPDVLLLPARTCPRQPLTLCRTALRRAAAGPLGYSLYGEIETKTKFWGKTIDCILAGHVSLRLKGHDEEYRWGSEYISNI